MTDILWLIGAAALAYVAGVAVIYALTGNLRHVRRYQALALVALLVALLLVIARTTGWLRGLGILLLPLGFAAGYLRQARTFLATEDTRFVPALARDPSTKPGFTAVIYLTPGEPEHYDPTGLLNAFREADAAGLPSAPLWARPLAVSQLRRQYLGGAQSAYRHGARRALKALEQAAPRADPPTRFYLAFLDDEPSAEAAVIQALNDGAARLVVLEGYVAATPHAAAARARMVAAAAPTGVPLDFAPSLAQRAALQSLYAARAAAWAAQAGGAPESVGVLLAAPARPAAWAAALPQAAAAEAAFLAAAADALRAAGFAHVRVARLHGAPSPAAAAAELAAAGARTILYTVATEAADSRLTHGTLPAALARAQLPADVQLVNLGGWNDDPRLIAALQEALRSCTPAP